MKLLLKYITLVVLLFHLSSCINCATNTKQHSDNKSTIDNNHDAEADLDNTQHKTKDAQPIISETAKKLDSMGLINISTLDPDIVIKMIYATEDNFTHETLYNDLVEAYFLPEVAKKIVAAHKELRKMHPHYRFIIYDAARPMSVQQKMRNIAVSLGKGYYVANPANGGGLHNYGAAVDLTILNQHGTPLPMGSEFDYFGEEANTNNEKALVESGKITQEEYDNRLLLRELMINAGFRTITSEWWHFNHCLRAEAIEKYRVIDF